MVFDTMVAVVIKFWIMKRIAKHFVTMVILLTIAPIAIVALFVTSIVTGSTIPQTMLKIDRYFRKCRVDEARRE